MWHKDTESPEVTDFGMFKVANEPPADIKAINLTIPDALVAFLRTLRCQWT